MRMAEREGRKRGELAETRKREGMGTYLPKECANCTTCSANQGKKRVRRRNKKGVQRWWCPQQCP